MNEIRLAETADLSGMLTLYRHLHAADTQLPEPTVVERVWTTMLAHSGLKCIVARHPPVL
jgi:hypothetical protein